MPRTVDFARLIRRELDLTAGPFAVDSAYVAQRRSAGQQITNHTARAMNHDVHAYVRARLHESRMARDAWRNRHAPFARSGGCMPRRSYPRQVYEGRQRTSVVITDIIELPNRSTSTVANRRLERAVRVFGGPS